MIADQANLYILIEAQTNGGQTKIPTPDFPGKDSINILLKPNIAEEIIYRFTLDPDSKTKQDAAKGFIKNPLDPRFGNFDPDWSGVWTYTTKLDGKNSKSIHFISIPFKTIGMEKPTDQTIWRGNISRIRIENKERIESSQWSFNSSTKILDDQNDFGEFEFKASKEK